MDAQRTNQSPPGVSGPLIAFGIALILGGCLMAVVVVQELLGVYRMPDSSPFVGELIGRFKDAEMLLFGGESLLVTEQGATVLAILLFILLALLVIHIAVAFIRAGAHIVSPAFPYQLAQIRLRIDNLRDRISGKG